MTDLLTCSREEFDAVTGRPPSETAWHNGPFNVADLNLMLAHAKEDGWVVVTVQSGTSPGTPSDPPESDCQAAGMSLFNVEVTAADALVNELDSEHAFEAMAKVPNGAEMIGLVRWVADDGPTQNLDIVTAGHYELDFAWGVDDKPVWRMPTAG